ncbi:hypothetical protein JST97_13025 [bacterium]|nr:hypothetical protein [bacterium]
MKIQASIRSSQPPRRAQNSRENPGDLFTRSSQPTSTSPILRHALVGVGLTGTATGALLLSGQSLAGALHTVLPLAGLGAMGYLIYQNCRGALEPDVALSPQLDQLLVGRFSGNDKQSVQKALNALGPQNVERLIQGGVKLLVDSDRVPAKAGACYYPDQRLACFRRGWVDRHYVIHELGHALDNLASRQSGERYRSQSDSLLQQNYQRNLEKGSSYRTQWSAYAQTNPQEYLAEGVTYYLESDTKKSQLQRKDPQHYHYIEGFLNERLPGKP